MAEEKKQELELPNTDIGEFVGKIQSSYGNYMIGMARAILDRFKECSREDITKLYNYIIDTREIKGPPPLGSLMNHAHELGIKLKKKKNENWVCVCPKCGMHLPLDYVLCGDCLTRRDFYGPTHVKIGKLFDGHPVYSQPTGAWKTPKQFVSKDLKLSEEYQKKKIFKIPEMNEDREREMEMLKYKNKH